MAVRQENSLPQGSRHVGHEIKGLLRHRLRKAPFPERFPPLKTPIRCSQIFPV